MRLSCKFVCAYVRMYPSASCHMVVLASHNRCIKPNDVKSSEQFNTDKVRIQLKYTGIVETTRIRKEVRALICRLPMQPNKHSLTSSLTCMWNTKCDWSTISFSSHMYAGLLSQNYI